MSVAEAAGVLGVAVDADDATVRRAYRGLIAKAHPDRAGASSSDRASRIIAAYQVLRDADPADREALRPDPPGPRPDERRRTEPGTGSAARRWWRLDDGTLAVDPATPPAIARSAGDSLLFDAPAAETFAWLLHTAPDIGEVTYVDRSVPILEVLCQFLGEPATSLLITLQGRALGTEAFCTAESIEARPGPPTAAVVDVLEDALRNRLAPPPSPS